MTYTNFLIYNSNNKLSRTQILEKLKAFFQKESYDVLLKENKDRVILLQNNVSVIFSENTKFISLYDPNIDSFELLDHTKSYIRKLSKLLTLPVFCITALEDKHVIIQQYHFNKRVYDYISVGEKQDFCTKHGYECYHILQHPKIWEEYCVGRNDLSQVDEIIKESNQYDDICYVIEEFFKMYGVKAIMSLYHGSITQINEADTCYILL